MQWHWGEWWNHGHKKWDREAEEFIKTLPLKRKTLKEYGSVCNLVKPSMRMDSLSFTHHQLVASLHEDPKEQKMWLKRVKKNNWPVSADRPASGTPSAYALPGPYKGFENRQPDLSNPLEEPGKRRGKPAGKQGKRLSNRLIGQCRICASNCPIRETGGGRRGNGE